MDATVCSDSSVSESERQSSSGCAESRHRYLGLSSLAAAVPLSVAGATLGVMDTKTRTLEDVLRDLDGGLRNLYGRRYRGLVLYGSHARGEANEGSDVDLLLLLEGPVEVGKEIRRSSDVVASLALEVGLVLSLIPVSAEKYRTSTDPYLINARREGAVLPLATK